MDFSIIIPTYNRKSILAETLSRICNQDFPNHKYEVIVIDDCSTDGTKEYLKSHFREEIIVLFNDLNLGRAKTRNRGIIKARGKYILMIDDDILADKDLINAHYQRHNKHCQEIAVAGAILVADGVPKTAVNEYLSSHHIWAYNEMSLYEDALPFTFFKTANLSMSRQLIKKAGYFDESFVQYGCEDTEFGYRLRQNCIKLFFDKSAIGYHYHNENIHTLIEKIIELGKSSILINKLHPNMNNENYNGFFTPDYHKIESPREVLYNLIKYFIFNRLGRKTNEYFICIFNEKKYFRQFIVKYLLPILKMQYLRVSTREGYKL